MKIFIAGHNGMVGSALVRRLRAEPGVTLSLRPRPPRSLPLSTPAALSPAAHL
jgi:GDP-L-fucose synthase